MNKKALAACGCLLLSGCASMGGSGLANQIEKNNTWVLSSMDGKPASMDARVTLSFNKKSAEGGRLEGNASCNRFFGNYVVEDEKVRMGALGSTMMSCPDPLMEQERSFLRHLQQSEDFKISGQTLTVMTKAGVLKFNTESEQVKVTVFPEGGELPADATVKVFLQDVSRQDSRAVVLGSSEVSLDKPLTSPLKVQVNYAPHLIDTSRSYSVSVRVVSQGRLIYINKEAIPVSFNESSVANSVEAKVEQVQQS